VALDRERTIPTERPPLVDEVSANFFEYRVSRGQRNGSPRPCSRFSIPEPLLFLLSSSSIVLPMLSWPRSRPTTSQNIWYAGNRTRDLWICSQELWPLDHRGGRASTLTLQKNYSNLFPPCISTIEISLISFDLIVLNILVESWLMLFYFLLTWTLIGRNFYFLSNSFLIHTELGTCSRLQRGTVNYFLLSSFLDFELAVNLLVTLL
jgi:hypothetical protein